MSWSDGGAGWAGWLLISVVMITFWVLVAMAIMALLPGVQNKPDARRRGPEPREAVPRKD